MAIWGRSLEAQPGRQSDRPQRVFVIGPDKKVKLSLVYPMTRGRNFDEVLRAIDSLSMTAKHKWQRR